MSLNLEFFYLFAFFCLCGNFVSLFVFTTIGTIEHKKYLHFTTSPVHHLFNHTSTQYNILLVKHG
jgi:hypothetical protein